jgi:hypothetical protein
MFSSQAPDRRGFDDRLRTIDHTGSIALLEYADFTGCSAIFGGCRFYVSLPVIAYDRPHGMGEPE